MFSCAIETAWWKIDEPSSFFSPQCNPKPRNCPNPSTLFPMRRHIGSHSTTKGRSPPAHHHTRQQWGYQTLAAAHAPTEHPKGASIIATFSFGNCINVCMCVIINLYQKPNHTDDNTASPHVVKMVPTKSCFVTQCVHHPAPLQG